MLKTEDLEILGTAVRRAAAHVGWAGKPPFDRELFPFWSDAVHEMLKRRGCPCAKGLDAGCFLKLPPEERVARFAVGDLSLANFVSMYEEARKAFFVGLTASAEAGGRN